MRPTFDQIRTAAYERWQRRGGAHGSDRDDWLAAEKHGRFTANYRLAAAHRLDPEPPRTIGASARNRCRFCGHAAPRTGLTTGAPIFPEALGPGGPVALDQCEECASLFAETIEPGLSRFLLAGPSSGLPGIGVDAFKGLVKLALAIMPAADLDDHEETVEWISNPDHDFDLNVFRDLTCAVHRRRCAEQPMPASSLDGSPRA